MFWFDNNSKLVAAVLLIVFALVGCGGAEERKAKYLERGKSYFEEENYDKAKVEFRNVLQIDPKTAEPHYYLGRIAEIRQEIRVAFASYGKAVELDPEMIDARIRLGRIYTIAGDLENAASQADEVIQRQPENADALTLRASVLMREGKDEEEIQILKQVLATTPGHVDAASLLSAAYLKLEDKGQALQVLETAVAANPDSDPLKLQLVQRYSELDEREKVIAALEELISNNPDVLNYRVILASYNARIGDNENAEKVIREAIVSHPDDSQTYLLLADFLNNTKGIDAAIDELENSSRSSPGLAELKFALAGLYQASAQPAKAESIYQGIIDKQAVEPDALRARIAIAGMKFKAGEPDAASRLLAEVLAENPQDSGALLLTGRIALAEKNYSDAVSAFRAVLKDQPDSVQVHTLLATTYQLSGEDELAEESLRQAVDANPADISARIRLAGYFANNGNLDGAMQQIDAALETEEDSVPAWRAKAEILAKRGEMGELEDVLTKLEQISPESGLGAFGKGRLYKAQKKYPEAHAAFEEAYVLEPESILVLSELVETEVRMGEPDKAISRLEKILQDDPEHQTAHYLLGSVYFQIEDFARAEKEYELQQALTPVDRAIYQRLASARMRQDDREGAEQALRQGLDELPGDRELYGVLANISVRQGDMDGAVDVYQQALEDRPGDLLLSLSMAGVYERFGKYKEAIPLYEELYVANPDSVMVINNLAALLADHRTDEASLGKASELADKLAASTQPALLDTVGWVRYRLGEYDKAADILSGVVEAAPNEPVFLYHLGMAYYQQGDKRAAKQILAGAVADNVSYVGVEDARRVYAELGGQ